MEVLVLLVLAASAGAAVAAIRASAVKVRAINFTISSSWLYYL